MTHERDNYDSPWKEAIEHWFEPFMQFFFPDIHAQIDWAMGYEFLDTELIKITGDAHMGHRFADKIIQVYLRSGEIAWMIIFIHVEVQGQNDPNFAKRMFVYHYRIFDYADGKVVSLAILADEDEDWRPNSYAHEQWGCVVNFTFPTVKLLDYRKDWDALEQSTNPFATVVMAHMKTQETRQKGEERKQWKLALLKRLYDQEYTREQIQELLRFLDWIMRLPEEMQQQFVQEWKTYEEAKAMRYMMSFERDAMEKGIVLGRQEGIAEGIEKGKQEGMEEGLLQGLEKGLLQGLEKGLLQGVEKGRQEGVEEGARKGLLDGIALALELKFGDEAPPLLAAIPPTISLPHLRAIHQAIRTASTPDELRTVILNPPTENTETDRQTR